MSRRLALLGCVCLASAVLLSAAPAKGKKYALLVGVTDYKNDALRPLKYTENDVEELAKLLRSKASGFDEVRVLSHARGRKDAKDLPTAANIERAIDDLVADKGRHDTVLIGLSGHGVQLEVKDPDEKGKPRTYPYFCPSDADFLKVSYGTGRSKRLLLLGDLFDRVGKCGASNRLVLIDACRNEADAASSTRNADVESVRVPKGVGVLFSCKSGERAWETDKLGKGHGVFFYHVVKGLAGEAKNRRGQVTWQSLASYVCTEVSEETPRLIGKGAEQTPHGILNLASLPVLAVIEKGEPAEREVVKDDPGKEPVEKEMGKTITNSIGMKLVRIPKGTFTMGSPRGEKDRFDGEGPEHEVEITKDFYLGVYEVTQDEYEKVMGGSPSYFSAGNAKVDGMDTSRFPVERVSYEDAVKFCQRLSARPKEKDAKRLYRLPTEAEWEYSCRGGAGSKTPFHYGDSLSSDQANFDGDHPYGGAAKGTYLGRTCKVGSYKPNSFGLYDMHGNVWEWCADWYGKEYYADSPAKNPAGPSEGTVRVIRGGSWHNGARACRSAFRGGNGPAFRHDDLGFRVALVPVR